MENQCRRMQMLFSELLDRDLERAEFEQLHFHLTACGFCREQARCHSRLHRALGELAALDRIEETHAGIRVALEGADWQSAPLEAAPVPCAEPARSRVGLGHAGWLTGTAALLLLALGIGWTLWQGSSHPVVQTETPAMVSVSMAHLVEVRGEVYRIDGDRRIPASAGQELRGGQGLQTVGEDSSAAIVYADGTRLDIGQDSLIDSLDEDGSDPPQTQGKRVSLAEGFLCAEVAKQPEGRPMVLMTPYARVVVKGTRFNLINLSQATRVEVENGAVDVVGRGDGQSLHVTAGSFSVVSEGAKPPMAAQSMATKITQPHLRFSEGSGRVLTLAVAPGGQTLATGGKDGKVRIWDLNQNEGQTPFVINVHPREEVRALAYSPDGKILAVGGGVRHLVKLFDPTTGREIATLTGHRTWIESLAFTADGRTLIVAGAHGHDSHRIYFWDVEQRRVLSWVDGHPAGVWSATVSPDGQLLATAGRDGTIKLWNVETRQLQRNIPAHNDEVNALAFSPDGQTLLSGSKDRTAKLWNVATGQALQTLVGHAYNIRGVAFAPDGKTVATGSLDRSVRLWDVADGHELANFQERGGGGVYAVAFSPDGTSLISSGWVKDVKLWRVPPH